MKNIGLVLGLFIIAFGFQSCSTDFDPNDEWTETTLVYGLIDQDEDTTFLRIQRCYLGAGNLLEYSKNQDSNTYADGELQVRIAEWTAKRLGNITTKDQPTGRELVLERIILNKPAGDFFSPNQPVYFAPSKNWYSENNIYVLEIKNLKTGNTVTSETSMVKDGISLIKPTRNFSFETTVSGKQQLNLQWRTTSNGIIYQPIIRFFYYEDSILKNVDLKMSMQKNLNNSDKMSASLELSTFGAFLKAKLDNGKPKLGVDSLDIIISAAGEDFSVFVDSKAPSTGIVQERLVYTNINNGIGIFTSRRTKLNFKKRKDNKVSLYIAQLNIGF